MDANGGNGKADNAIVNHIIAIFFTNIGQLDALKGNGSGGRLGRASRSRGLGRRILSGRGWWFRFGRSRPRHS